MPVMTGALFEAVLLAAGTVGSVRDADRSWYGHLAGPLLVPASSTAGVQEQLAPGDHGLRVVLVAEPAAGDPAGLLALREARNRLLDDDRLELTGIHVPLPSGAPMGALLAELDVSVPAWVEVPPAAGWQDALAALAADGAEHLAVRLPRSAPPGPDGVTPDAPDLQDVAAVVRRAVDLDLVLRVTGAGGGSASTVQLLAALCVVRAALDGADAERLAAVLAERDVAPLGATLQGASEADAAAVRVVLDAVVVPDVEQTARELAALGLVDPADGP